MAFNFFQYWIYDVIFLFLFCLFLVIFLVKRRKNLKREGLMYLYRTKVGIRFIDYVGKKYKKSLVLFSYLSVISGYILMVLMVIFLGLLVKTYILNPSLVRTIKVAPLMPLIPYVDTIFKVDFLPPFYFTYWIIAIAVIAIFHEFAHGIVARRYGVKIKATGFGFLGPFLAAFVDPDEKQMNKKTKFEQLSILASGTFTNLVLAIIFFILLSLFFIISYMPSGAIIGGYIAEPVKISSISYIGGYNLTNTTKVDLINVLDKELTNDITFDITGVMQNATKIIADNRTYYMNVNLLKNQLNMTNEQVILFPNLSAIMSGMRVNEVITQVDDKKIGDINDLAVALNNSYENQNIKIKTKYKNETYEYNITLTHDPYIGKPVVGVGFTGSSDNRLASRISNFFNIFKKPSTYYEPRFNNNLVIFIYNLIWWLALINLSVALMNMLPVGIFDGGRFFMITIWGITGNKKLSENAFKIVTYLILASFIVLMVGWAFAMYLPKVFG